MFSKKRKDGAQTVPLTPTEIAKEIELDSAIVGVSILAHRIRNMSTFEYYQLVDFNVAKIKRIKYDRTHFDARKAIARVPSTKTTNRTHLSQTLQFIFRNFSTTVVTVQNFKDN
ncbi:hypothetical protein CU098_008120 [Rhizopus stolonifer]|uniref:Uncharacterized protein n=1 Tax=Rhizopus stolonifer TaxID=4846 RepID=A0A367KJB6_RHIST|nr:hypothetical protein CU098_008120 [Rhizopus stolonifer]